MAFRVIFIGTSLLSLTSSLPDSSDCLVTTYTQVRDAAAVSILSFINLNIHLDFVLEFEQLDVTYWRDWVELANSGVTRSMVQEGVSEGTKYALPLVIPEGWTNLRLQAVKRHFSLTLVSGDDDEATLLNLKLDFPVRSVHVQGNFSLCAGASPEWEVSEGREVPVPLQPRGNQQLQVTSRGSAAPYLMVPSVPPRNTSLSANATLSIVTKRRDTVTLIQVSQENEVKLKEEAYSIASPIVVLGSHGGDLHLRLDLSPLPLNTPLPKNDSGVDTCGGSTSLWLAGFGLFFGGVVLGCLVGMTIALVWRRKKTPEVTDSAKALLPNTSMGKEKWSGI